MRFRNGNFTAPIVAPNDTGNFTFVIGINTRRMICGYFLNAGDNLFHGFLHCNNTFRQIDIGPDLSTFVIGINDANDYCGSFGSVTQPVQGFAHILGSDEFFSVPGATRTDANSLNCR